MTRRRSGLPVARLHRSARYAVGAATAALALVSALGALLPRGPAPAQGAPPPAAPAPIVALAAFRGQGRLAIVWAAGLYVADGMAGTIRQISSAGVAAHPTWSHDGRWIAYLRLSQPGSRDGEVWIASTDGRRNYRTGLTVRASLEGPAWSPTADTLAASIQDSAGSAELWLTSPGGIPRRETGAGNHVSSIAWSPDGTMIAYVTTVSSGVRRDAVDTVRLGDGKIVARYAAPADVGVELAGWWPNGRGLVFWADPDYSASLAADGLDLFSLTLGRPTPRLLAGTLPYRDWLSWAPNGRTLLLVDGGGREAWREKRLAICDVGRGACRPVPQPRGVVSLDPAWAPDGSVIAFVRAAETLPPVAGSRAGADWTSTRTMWLAGPDGSGARDLSYARSGVFNPTWSADSRALLFWQDDALWLWRSGTGDVTRIVGPFPTNVVPVNFFGHVSWPDVVSWYRP